MAKPSRKPQVPDEEREQHQSWRLDFPCDDFLDLINTRARYKGYWGGRGSGKTESMARALVYLAFYGIVDINKNSPRYGQIIGPRILCCREIQESIEDSSKQVIDDVIAEWGLGWFFTSTRRAIYGKNGSRFSFEGLFRNSGKIKSKKGVNFVWVDEAHAISAMSLHYLTPTIREPGSELWFSWNPEKATDPVDQLCRQNVYQPDPELMQDYDVWQIVRKVNWDKNKYFPNNLRVEMERDKLRDPGMYAHKWLGEYLCRSEARVFRNWRISTPEEFDQFAAPGNPAQPGQITIARYYFGADWGFSIDPSVLVRCFIVDRRLYVDAEVYVVGCEIDHLPFLFGGLDDPELKRMNMAALDNLVLNKRQLWRGIPGSRRWPIIADSSRPDTISFMQRHGFARMTEAKKGAGSVNEGIEFLQSMDIIVHPDCTNTIHELSNYSYETDPKTEEVLPVLEDKDNHVIDALRYALEGARHSTYNLDALAT